MYTCLQLIPSRPATTVSYQGAKCMKPCVYAFNNITNKWCINLGNLLIGLCRLMAYEAFRHSPTNGISTSKYTNGSNGEHVPLAWMTNVKTHWNNTVIESGLQSDRDLWIPSDKNKLKCRVAFNHNVHKGFNWSSWAPLACRKTPTDKKRNWLRRSLQVLHTFTHHTDSEFLSCFHAVFVPFWWHYLVLVFSWRNQIFTNELRKKLDRLAQRIAIQKKKKKSQVQLYRLMTLCFLLLFCSPSQWSHWNEWGGLLFFFFFIFFYYTVLLSDRNTAKGGI